MTAPRPARIALLACGMLALLAGLYGGLARAGWLGPTDLASLHGPLMVMAFLGTLIPLERAVALNRPWGYLAPALAGIGGLLLLLGVTAGGVLLTAGAGITVAVYVALARREPAIHVAILTLGAVVLLASNAAWLWGASVPTVVWGWVGFLVLTIVGERIELSRVRRPPRWAELMVLALLALHVAGLLVKSRAPGPGNLVVGGSLVALSGWLLSFDVARDTIRGTGLPRFVAACLLTGYAWLGIGGALMIVWGHQVAGLRYDAQLHAVLVGFVLSMIFGHAPVIFPAVLKLPIRYHAGSWGPLVVLHGSLAARIVGDVVGSPQLRAWGALGNAVAVGLFLVTTGFGIASRSVDEPRHRLG